MMDIAKHSKVSYATIKNSWKDFVKEKRVVFTRNVGKAKMYKLNVKNPIIKKFIDYYWKIIEQESEEKIDYGAPSSMGMVPARHFWYIIYIHSILLFVDLFGHSLIYRRRTTSKALCRPLFGCVLIDTGITQFLCRKMDRPFQAQYGSQDMILFCLLCTCTYDNGIHSYLFYHWIMFIFFSLVLIVAHLHNL